MAAPGENETGERDMYTDRKLYCKAHGESCTGNPKKAHIFVWVKL